MIKAAIIIFSNYSFSLFSSWKPVQPPGVIPTDPARSYAHPMPVQPFPAIPAANMGFTSLPQQSQFHNSSVLPPRPHYPIQKSLLPPGITVPNPQMNNQVAPDLSFPQLTAPAPANFASSSIGVVAPLPSSYTFSPHGLQNQVNLAASRPLVQYTPMPLPHVSVSLEEQSRLTPGSTPTSSIKPISEASSVSEAVATEPNVQLAAGVQGPIDWIEHTSPDGRRYYYNKKTKQSTWQKPFELMTAIERADASTDWREYKSADGRMYYYNMATKQSKWEMPQEMKLARERATKTDIVEAPLETRVTNEAATSVEESSLKSEASSSIQASRNDAQPAVMSTSAISSINTASIFTTSVNEVSLENTKQDVSAAEMAQIAPETANIVRMPEANSGDLVAKKVGYSEISAHKKSKDAEAIDEKAEVTLEDKLVNQEPLPYANKLEARNAFKALLEAANVGSDWTWERAMRVIITDKRYGALKSLGERKEVFNEFVSQKKRQESEEKRIKQKKAREDFRKMLEECKELTSSSRWSKIVHLFEDDERFKAIERERDRKDLFGDYIDELEKQERAKAAEDRKRNVMEYRQFLESCNFITASSQWRKVQDRLEADERCSRLEKIDRLEIFQEYLRDLEREEEEQRNIQKEGLRKVERKNRDEFRRLIEEHVASGIITARTHWRDYSLKIKDLPEYVAVASNKSGSNPKELFEDVVEELEKKYEDDKAQIEGAAKLRKVDFSATMTLEELKTAIADDLPSTPISDTNFKLAFDELLEKARKKEEKEAKKRRRLGDKFFDLLQSIREITISSTWEDCRHLVERSQEYSSIKDESSCREIFDEYIAALNEKEKEYERRHKEEKERDRERHERERIKGGDRRGKDRHNRNEEESQDDTINDDNAADANDNYSSVKRRKPSSKDTDRERKHHKSRHDAPDDSNETETDQSRRSSHRHSRDHKKSKQRELSPESAGEDRHKRHKKDPMNRSRNPEELEDGEFNS
ncbi:hypothetical protein SAY86_000591 [Trapa natans]|uniref:Pre-mRNA-processing protein 40A n=1 Tax=Trapa natans TaxID=22666 RepID=A0AAN7N1Q4_TRANT|nr:hypothetical protein SAY86_000591 [Trapa natans]